MSLTDILQGLQERIRALEEEVKVLKKDSHPSIDFIERICQAINSGELQVTTKSLSDGKAIAVKAEIID